MELAFCFYYRIPSKLKFTAGIQLSNCFNQFEVLTFSPSMPGINPSQQERNSNHLLCSDLSTIECTA